MADDEHRSRELVEALLNGSLDPALLIDGNGRVLMVNRIVAERLGKAPKDLMGATLYDLFPREIADARLAIVRLAIATGAPVRYQDGHFGRHFDSLVSPVRDSGGNITSVAVYSRDVTQHHMMDQEIMNAGTRERQKLGRDLHDRLGQQLTGIRFLIAALVAKARDQDKSLAAEAQRIEELVLDATEQVRRISRGVAPVGMEDSNIEVALRRLANDTEEIFRISCSTRIREDSLSIVDGTVATEVYWIAAEAVSNAVKHGSPSKVEISLSIGDEEGILCVKDNGTGLPAVWESKGGMGVRIMRYRASVIGAQIGIESPDSGGTVVTCRFNTRLTPGQVMPGGNPMPVR